MSEPAFRGRTAPRGELGLRVIRGDGSVHEHETLSLPPRVTAGPSLWQVTKACWPRSRWHLRNLPHLWRGYRRLLVARLAGAPTMTGALYLRKINPRTGLVVDYGLVSLRVVTTAGVNYLVDALQGTVEPENLRYHGFGTGGGAEATGNTALTTELTTQYATDNTRPTGTLAEGASANIFRTVGTLDPDADVAITEHGIFDQAATGGGTLLDRTLFSVINLSGSNGDQLEATYELTLTAGS